MKPVSVTWGINLFDRLHVGHQVLLDRLAEMPGPTAVVAGGEVVSESLEFAGLVQPVDLRVARLREYLCSNGLDSISVRTTSSYDDFTSVRHPISFLMFEGPCCKEIEARVLDMRQSFGFGDNFELMKPVRADDGGKVSSARIRRGEIDRTGRSLKGTTEPPRRLDLQRRGDLKAPKGELFHVRDGPPESRVVKRLIEEGPPHVIAVGDVTSATLAAQGYHPQVCIVDRGTKRGAYVVELPFDRQYTIYNPPAVIYPESWSTIDTALSHDVRSVIFVEGEEDLLGFPAVLLAPLGSVMLYGQPDAGIVYVPIDRHNKSAARSLLDQMPILT